MSYFRSVNDWTWTGKTPMHEMKITDFQVYAPLDLIHASLWNNVAQFDWAGAHFINSLSIVFQIRFTLIPILKQLQNIVYCNCAVRECAKICCGLVANNRITARQSFHRIWIACTESFVKRASGLFSFCVAILEYCGNLTLVATFAVTGMYVKLIDLHLTERS